MSPFPNMVPKSSQATMQGKCGRVLTRTIKVISESILVIGGKIVFFILVVHVVHPKVFFPCEESLLAF